MSRRKGSIYESLFLFVTRGPKGKYLTSIFEVLPTCSLAKLFKVIKTHITRTRNSPIFNVTEEKELKNFINKIK